MSARSLSVEICLAQGTPQVAQRKHVGNAFGRCAAQIGLDEGEINAPRREFAQPYDPRLSRERFCRAHIVGIFCVVMSSHRVCGAVSCVLDPVHCPAPRYHSRHGRQHNKGKARGEMPLLLPPITSLRQARRSPIPN